MYCIQVYKSIFSYHVNAGKLDVIHLRAEPDTRSMAVSTDAHLIPVAK